MAKPNDLTGKLGTGSTGQPAKLNLPAPNANPFAKPSGVNPAFKQGGKPGGAGVNKGMVSRRPKV